MDTTAMQALVRFGLGRRGDEPLPANPGAWLAGQLAGPDPATAGPTAADGLRALAQQFAMRRARAQAARAAEAMGPGAAVAVPGVTPVIARAPVAATGNAQESAPGLLPGPAGAPPPAGPGVAAPGALPGGGNPARVLFREDCQGLMDGALRAATPFRERLVLFWANHFTVSLRQGQVAPLAGAFVREAIRPHVTGRFSDMLLAVMHHPAMLIYLDNAASVGPHSRAGLRSGRGLNENLARECLELHTVSPAAGYTQADVTAFAAVLTGWSVERREEPLGFRFRPQAHEPGDKVVLGRTVPEGQEGGVAFLRFLADHPATHRHLAAKLACHLVADNPAPADVRAIEAALRDTGGNLGAAALAATRLPAAWTPGTKLRSPQDYVLASLRLLDLPGDARTDPVRAMGALGQPPFYAGFPIGWPDRGADWAGPEAVLRRVDWAYGLAGRAGAADPFAMADRMGPLLQPATLEAMRHAGSRRDAMTLLLAGPEFQRR